MTSIPSTRRASPWPRIRAVGAVAAVSVFLGTAALAPYSMSSAFALDGQQAPVDEAQQALLSSAAAPGLLIDTAVAAIKEEDPEKAAAPKGALFSIEEFMFTGAVNWGGYRFTFYSQQVLPGPGLAIPGRHVNAGGYVADEDGFIVLAGSHPKGTVFETPFGYPGKIYDRGTFGNHLDVYIR